MGVIMRRVILTLVALTGLSGAARLAHATEVGNSRNFGLGVQLGDPTAITGKVFMGRSNALDFGLGFGGGWGYYGGWCVDNLGRRYHCGAGWDTNHYSIHADFLWQDNLTRSQVQLDWHIGVGGRLFLYDYGAYNHDVAFDARMPVGLDLYFDRPSFLELYFEIAPGLFLYPGLWLDFDADIGVRFYF
jgi:hypothetical protein